MPVSQNQRLRKAAAKASKRKAVAADKLARERRALAISKPRHIDFAISPIVACTISGNLESGGGIRAVTVARRLPLGRYGFATFLLDVWCLGVKGVLFRVMESEQYELSSEVLASAGACEPIDPAQARKLVREAAAYGAGNGFPPLDDFAEADRIFGDIAPAGASFTFGDGGKPHFVAGPLDSPRRCAHVIRVLTQRFGPDGFDFTLPLEFDEDDEADFLQGEAHELAADAPGEAEQDGDLRAA